ncbi:MAG TPA: TIGR01777 family protein [candidate division Zixibacteria bacterium]|nr:TIGR01777 family protein [candidate division Zixibacteria bacterium]
MKILLTGASGLVGKLLIPVLKKDDHQIVRLVRSKDQANENTVYWSPLSGEIEVDRLRHIDAVIHLAGEPIMGRWTDKKKERIRQSRADATHFLCKQLVQLTPVPRTLIAASAIGYYGNRPDAWVDEDAPSGTGFLPEVCSAWEEATESARKGGIRVVNLRIGIVLSPDGGALAKMLTPFRLGMGGKIGDGKQYMSWLMLEELIGMIQFALRTESLSGPVNAVAPNPVTNLEMTRILGSLVHRPTIFAVPSLAVRILFGEMGIALLLAGARVKPVRLSEAGYEFKHPDLEQALGQVLT